MAAGEQAVMGVAARSIDEHAPPAVRPSDVRIDPQTDTGLRNLLRLVTAPDGLGRCVEPFPQTDWGALVDRLRDAGRHTRAVEAQVQEQDVRVQELLDHVREEIRGAEHRVQDAESRARDIQAQAASQVMIAEEKAAAATVRAEAAEARARVAEQWLAQVQDTIVAEFSKLPA